MGKQELDHVDHSLYGREETNPSPGLFIKRMGGAGIINLVSLGFSLLPFLPFFFKGKAPAVDEVETMQ